MDLSVPRRAQANAAHRARRRLSRGFRSCSPGRTPARCKCDARGESVCRAQGEEKRAPPCSKSLSHICATPRRASGHARTARLNGTFSLTRHLFTTREWRHSGAPTSRYCLTRGEDLRPHRGKPPPGGAQCALVLGHAGWPDPIRQQPSDVYAAAPGEGTRAHTDR